MTILTGIHSFPYNDLGGKGCGKFATKMKLSIGGASDFFPEKEKEMKICCCRLL